MSSIERIPSPVLRVGGKSFGAEVTGMTTKLYELTPEQEAAHAVQLRSFAKAEATAAMGAKPGITAERRFGQNKPELNDGRRVTPAEATG